jgi:large repetitive protein
MVTSAVQAAGFGNPQPGANDPADVPFAAGAYIIDAGTVTGAATTQTIGQGLKQYGLLYALVKARIPVQWIIKPNKPSTDASGVSAGGIGQTRGNVGADFSYDCDAAGTKYVSRDFTTGAFVIAKEFVAQAKPVIDTFRAANGGQPAAGTVSGVAQTAPQIFGYDSAAGQTQGCSNPTPTLPVFATLAGYPRTVLDSTNGSIAVGFYANAGIPQGAVNVPNNPPAYRFASASQLTPCDDYYVMPHADPTYATHQNLKAFNDQGGYIWAGCHAVSVLENVRVNDSASGALFTNFLTTDGLLPFGSHAGGSPPYSFFTQTTDTKPYYSPTFGGSALDPVSSGDPVAQFRGRTDLAQQNGSEQIYMPGYGGTPTRTAWLADKSTASKWRPTTQIIIYDPTQANVYPLTTTAVPVNSLGPAATVVYGRGFGNPTNGLVTYEAGHSIDKGTADDVAAQRAFFNSQLLNSLERSPKVTVSAPTAGAALSGNTTVPVSGVASGGSNSFTYQWTSTCTNATTGAAVPSGSFASATSAATTFTTPNVTGPVNCNLSLSVVDSCGRFGFGVSSVVVAPPADLRVTKTGPATVGLNGNVAYTLTVTNLGPGTAVASTLVDALPSGTTYVGHGATPTYATPASTPAGATGCTYGSGTLTCVLGDLASGQSASTTFTVQANVGGVTLLNTATVTSTTPDPVLTNNTASASTQVLNSGIKLVKTASPTLLPSAGATVTYTFTVTNVGDTHCRRWCSPTTRRAAPAARLVMPTPTPSSTSPKPGSTPARAR